MIQPKSKGTTKSTKGPSNSGGSKFGGFNIMADFMNARNAINDLVETFTTIGGDGGNPEEFIIECKNIGHKHSIDSTSNKQDPSEEIKSDPNTTTSAKITTNTTSNTQSTGIEHKKLVSSTSKGKELVSKGMVSKGMTTKSITSMPTTRKAPIKKSPIGQSTSSTTKLTNSKGDDVDFGPQTIPQLTWDDFAGEPKPNSWLAYTTYFVRYNFKTVTTNGKTTLQAIKAWCVLNKKTSWVIWRNQELLEHEIGHYLIGWISALTFKKRVLEAKLPSENTAQEISRIYKETLKEFRPWQIQYDEETEHYCNKENQAKWNAKIKKIIEELKPYL